MKLRLRKFPAWMAPAFVAACGAVITFAIWRSARADAIQDGKVQVELEMQDAMGRIRQRMDAYAQILRDGRTLFRFAPMDRAQFRAYVDGVDFDRAFPGIQGVGFAAWIPPGSKAVHEARVRAEGFPDYAIRPDPGAGPATAIVYLEPLTGRNLRAFGYDMYTDPVRRAAMDQAAAQDDIVVSGPVTLVQESGKDLQAGFLMYLPVRRPQDLPSTPRPAADRQQGLLGWIYAPFRMADLLEGTLGPLPEDLAVTLHDGPADGAGSLLFQAGTAPVGATARGRLEVGHRTWTVTAWRREPGVLERLRGREGVVILTGALATLLLATLAWELARARDLAMSRAQAGESMFKSLLDAIPDVVFFKGLDGRYLACNPAFQELEGRTRSEIVGLRDEDLYPPEMAAGFRRDDHRALEGGGPIHIDEVHHYPDGRVLHVDTLKSPVRDANGKVLGVLAVGRDVTEARNLRDELARLSREQQAILDSASVGITHVKDRHFVWTNRRMAGLVGWSSEELEGSSVRRVYPDEAAYEALRAQAYPVILAGGVHKAEVAMVRKDGTPIWVWLCGSLVDPQDPARGSIWTWEDITERKATEHKLSLSEARHRMLFDESPDAYLLMTGGRYTACNPSALSLLGVDRASLLGHSPVDFSPEVQPDGTPSVDLARRHLRRASEVGVIRFDWTHVRPDGTSFIATIALSRLPVPEGNTFLVSMRDETPRIQAERRLTYAMEATGEGIWDWEIRSGRVTHNVRWCRILGLDERFLEHPFDTFSAWIFPDDLPALQDRIQASLDTGAPYLSRHRLRRTDGETVWVLDRGQVVERDVAGAPLRMVGSIAEITDLMNAELAQRRALEEAGRLNSLLQEETQRANAASVAKSEFLANMSHEIRTPLHGVLGMAELLAGTSLSPEQQDYVLAINRSGEALLDLLNDLLDFSKIEAGQLSLASLPFDLEELVFEVAELFRARLRNRRVEVLVDYDPATPARVVGDAGRVRQVLNNLVSNAIKFTEEGHVFIGVEQDPDGPFRLTVQDTGIGIPEEKQGRLFQPFVQAESSTARRFGGTGLGLVLVKRILASMGGSVRLESRPGLGTTLFVELPLQADPAAPPEPRMPEDLAGKRILILDDNPLDQKLLARQLEAAGAEPACAASAPEARALLAEALAQGTPFDAVTVDFHLQGREDGSAFAQALREDPRFSPLALALLTGTAVGDGSVRRAGPWFDAYLFKPINRKSLVHALRAALGREPGRPEVVRQSLPDPIRRGAERPVQRLTGRVLLAEDHEVNQAIARKFLEEAGLEVTVARDGLEALAAAERTGFDLVLMDCQMPEMDGFQATRLLREQEALTGRRVPVVAMTANAMAGDRARCLDAGMDDYLTKPITREAMLTAVGRWLKGEAPTPVPDAAGSFPAPDPGLALDAVLFDKVWQVFGRDAVAFREAIVDPFLGRGIALVEDLRRAASEGDGRGLAFAAHALKGSARTIGLTALGTACERLEAAAEAGDPLPVPGLADAATEAFKAARAFLESLGGVEEPR